MRTLANKTAEVSIDYGMTYPPGQAPKEKTTTSAKSSAKSVIKRPYSEALGDVGPIPFSASTDVKKTRSTSTTLLLNAYHDQVRSERKTLRDY